MADIHPNHVWSMVSDDTAAQPLFSPLCHLFLYVFRGHLSFYALFYAYTEILTDLDSGPPSSSTIKTTVLKGSSLTPR